MTFSDPITGVPVKEWMCLKESGKTIDDDDNESKYVKRSCFAGKNFDAKCKESDALDSQYGVIQKGVQCYCIGEGCNAASHLGQGVLAFIISIFAITLRFIN